MRLPSWRIGLRTKILFGLLIPLAALFFLLTVANERYLNYQITGNYRVAIEGAAKSFVAGIEDHERADLAAHADVLVENMRLASHRYDQVVLLAPSGHSVSILAKSQEKPKPIAVDGFYEGAVQSRGTSSRETGDRLEIAVPVVFKDKTQGALIVRVRLYDRERLIKNLRDRAVVFEGLGLFLLSCTIYLGLRTSIINPLRKLQEATAKIGRGDFDALPALDRDDELGDLAVGLRETSVNLKKYTQTLERRVSELTLLYNISKVSSGSVNLDEALNIIINSAVKITEASSGFVMLKEHGIDSQEDRLKLKASIGLTLEQKKDALASEEISNFVFNSGGPLLLSGDITRLGFEKKKGFRGAIYAPIKYVDERIGIIGLLNKQNGDFSKKDLQLLLTLANQASGVIHSTHLFEDLQTSYFSTIQALAAAIDAKDPYTRGHSSRVAKYSELIACRLGCTEEQLKVIRVAAYLHDIGKIGVDEHILLKPGGLSDDEYRIVKEHPHISATILRRVTFLKEAVPMVRHHHERYDGKGYPDGLAGAAIPLGARIIAVADAFDAMTSDRPYRRSLNKNKAIEEIRRGVGKQFDEKAVDAFLACPDRSLQAAMIADDEPATFMFS